MPNINPKGAGDIVYPQYSRITYEPTSAIAIVKGRLYTKGSGATTANQLVAVAAAGFLNGIYQAMVSKTAGTAGADRIQCLGPGSRILLAAKTANLHAGQDVKYDVTNHNVELWTGTTGGVTPNERNSRIGRIFEIYTKSTITERKDVTAVGDLVVVEIEN